MADDANIMQKFFISRTSQVISGLIIGFMLGFSFRQRVVEMIGRKLFIALTTNNGLIVIIAVVVLTCFVVLTAYTWLTQRKQVGA